MLQQALMTKMSEFCSALVFISFLTQPHWNIYFLITLFFFFLSNCPLPEASWMCIDKLKDQLKGSEIFPDLEYIFFFPECPQEKHLKNNFPSNPWIAWPLENFCTVKIHSFSSAERRNPGRNRKYREGKTNKGMQQSLHK